jgi:hypothetical protein
MAPQRPRPIVESLATRFTRYHSSLATGVCLCPGRALDKNVQTGEAETFKRNLNPFLDPGSPQSAGFVEHLDFVMVVMENFP